MRRGRESKQKEPENMHPFHNKLTALGWSERTCWGNSLSQSQRRWRDQITVSFVCDSKEFEFDAAGSEETIVRIIYKL